MERILITGANGFIGSNLCRYFLDHSYEVAALVRRSSDLHFLEGMPVVLAYADLAEPAHVDLPPGIDYVIHAASLVVESMTMDDARRGIHDTTVNLLRILEENGIRPKRFVYISTALVLGHRSTNIAEGKRGAPARGLMPYVRAKEMAEATLLERCRIAGLPVVILRPSDVYGPNDRTSSLRLLGGIEDGWPVIAGAGRHVLSFCFVGNLARACGLACRMRGRDGAAYTVTNGQDVTWRRLMGYFQDRLSKKQRLFVPMAAAYAIALCMQLLHAVFPAFVMRVSFYPVSKVGRDTSYDIARTREELGYEPDQDLDKQLEAVVQWYLAEKASGRITRTGRRR